MKKMIDMENQIEEYEKKNEKTNNDTKVSYETQINKMETEINAKLENTEVEVQELNQNLEKMHNVGKEKLKYELELMAWQQDCGSLEKTI